ncbi:MAG: Eco57I restriction-modification methylase domain-containing protein [bacterium]
MSRDILQNIITDFDLQRLKRFFSEKNSKFRPSEQNFDYNTDNFSNGLKLGELYLDDGALLVCAFKAKQELSERSGKKLQYELGKKILKETQTDAGIFIYYNQAGSFRFSLIYANYLGKKIDWSAFRRFTYFVSDELTNKTFLQRIDEGDFSSLEKIKDAFSVEKVTTKFFDDFRLIFERTKQQFEQQNKNTVCLWLKDRYSPEEYKEQINRFVYTLLGRIVFIYFIQRKGWIENQKNYIRKTVENNNTNIYLEFFQPLFFDVFAKKKNERPEEIKKQYKDTPYLNGGLFEKSELENNLQSENKFILFDDEFIKDIILNFFESYNFTVDENSLDDQEVSIDPEMLGKVFENTLAEEERGKKGTFYTPREVVHFMVKDSLWQFLQNETNIDKKKLYKLIYRKEEIENLDLKKDEIRLLDDKLKYIKVLDPAVGSAAFPVEMMHIWVDLRKRLNVNVGKNINEVLLKKQFIKENLYGVDIDPGAIEIAKLRLWLALVVDYEKAEVEAEPLPNLDFQFRVGNSLQEKIDDIDIFNQTVISQQSLLSQESEFDKIKSEMLDRKDKFYISEYEKEKRTLKKEFDDREHKLISSVVKKYEAELESQLKNQHSDRFAKNINPILKKINKLKQKIKDGTYKLFKPDFHFSEVFDRKNENGQKIGGFDIVIGNPPYGVKVEEDIKDWHKLGSKDSYGVFVSTALRRFLKPDGVLSFIVSDTWLTIKTHKELRQQVLGKQLHKIIRVHQDCFDATVNACIMSVTNSPDNNSKLIVADLTNISTRKEVEDMRLKLYHLEDFIGQSTSKFAVYEYNQDLIKTNSNLPIFVGSPKLFALMDDTTCQTIEKEIGGKKIKVRQLKFNNKNFELVRFGDVADVRVGLQTGDNKFYLFQNPEARGSYKNINNFKDFLLIEKDLEKIISDEKLRAKVIEKGFHKSRNDKNFDEDLWFDGRFIVPYDKGGESDTETGWLPNYYVPTNYFIDWSQTAVKKMRQSGSARFQNKEYYFKYGITFSWAGVYCPTFRKSSILFDHGSSDIFINIADINQILGLICSKITKIFSRVFINHSINFGIDDVKEIPINIAINLSIQPLLLKIYEKQKQNPRYDYMSNEQKEIDKLVYEMYGLNADDIREVETWYARRYPKLARFCEF